MARNLVLGAVGAAALWVAGCQNCCPRPATPCPPPRVQVMPRAPVQPAPVVVPLPPPPTPAGGAPAASFLPPVAAPAPGATLAPPRIEANWQPTEAPAGPGRVQLAVPEPVTPTEARSGAATPEPPLAGQRLPVGIPQFAEVNPRVATGLRPALDDGLDWLAANGYRTVVNLHLPGEDDQAERLQVEKRGLTYVSVALAPETFTRAQADDFVALVRDQARQPLFVHDRDGALAGPLWYYVFRSADNLAPEAALARARTLGLREERGGPYQALWLAVQRVLGENSR